MIVLERDRAAVIVEEVGFDDQALLAPEEVHLPPPDLHVHLRPRQPAPVMLGDQLVHRGEHAEVVRPLHRQVADVVLRHHFAQVVDITTR